MPFPPLGPKVRVLLVWPPFPLSFWSFEATVKMAGYRAALPPLGLITVAALCPPHWEARVIDESIEPLTDEHLRWSNLVMVSGMEKQKQGVEAVLRRARALGRRTIVGGPYASSHPDEVLNLADHVVVGEPDLAFADLARWLETGDAPSLFEVKEKPDLTETPIPRYDLLKLEHYAMMSLQFSRGCPFQCEFCDIITIYGRIPRTKTPDQILRELDFLRRLGWNREVFLVDDNFIGNHKKAYELLVELERWQRRHNYPFNFFTEASVNLAYKPELLEAMVRANFWYVFIGIETPSEESLQETRKLQNLGRGGLLDSIRKIQKSGLWVMGGFILGFDSDDERIFKRMFEFIEEAAIPWAMLGILQAPRNTDLYTRLEREGRLAQDVIDIVGGIGTLEMPNFQTRLPLAQLLQGYCEILSELYAPEVFFKRVLRSLEHWRPVPPQTPPPIPALVKIRIVLITLWRQGIVAPYRWVFWKTLLTLLARWGGDKVKMQQGFLAIESAEHFIPYAKQQVERVQAAQASLSRAGGRRD